MSQRIDVLDHARHNDIARRVLQGQSVAEIARGLGLSARQCRRIIGSPEFRDTYMSVSEELYGGDAGVDTLLKDEKAASVLRGQAFETRAMTVLAEVMESVQEHMKNRPGGNAQSGHLRAAVDAVRLAGEMATKSKEQAEGIARHLHLHLTPDKVTTLQSSMAESGIDITEILSGGGGAIYDAVHVQEVQRGDGEPGARLGREPGCDGGGDQSIDSAPTGTEDDLSMVRDDLDGVQQPPLPRSAGVSGEDEPCHD